MSNIGLNATIYRATGKYLSLLNEFVAKAKTHSTTSELDTSKVVDFFTQLSDQETVNPQIQLLASIIERELRDSQKNPANFMTSLLSELQTDKIQETLPKIEIVIGALDNEHFEALSKIKGQ